MSYRPGLARQHNSNYQINSNMLEIAALGGCRMLWKAAFRPRGGHRACIDPAGRRRRASRVHWSGSVAPS